MIKVFGNWAMREGYPVDPALLSVRAPKVDQKEVESYTEQQIAQVLAALSPEWPALAVRIMLGTGVRVSELCDLDLEDFEDDDEAVEQGRAFSERECLWRGGVSHALSQRARYLLLALDAVSALSLMLWPNIGLAQGLTIWVLGHMAFVSLVVAFTRRNARRDLFTSNRLRWVAHQSGWAGLVGFVVFGLAVAVGVLPGAVMLIAIAAIAY